MKSESAFSPSILSVRPVHVKRKGGSSEANPANYSADFFLADFTAAVLAGRRLVAAFFGACCLGVFGDLAAVARFFFFGGPSAARAASSSSASAKVSSSIDDALGKRGVRLAVGEIRAVAAVQELHLVAGDRRLVEDLERLFLRRGAAAARLRLGEQFDRLFERHVERRNGRPAANAFRRRTSHTVRTGRCTP